MKRSGIFAGVHEVPPGEIAACMSAEGVDVDERRPSYPADAKDVPGDYVLKGDGRWYPHPKRKD